MPSSGFSCRSFNSLAIALMTAGGSGSAAWDSDSVAWCSSIVVTKGIDRLGQAGRMRTSTVEVSCVRQRQAHKDAHHDRLAATLPDQRTATAALALKHQYTVSARAVLKVRHPEIFSPTSAWQRSEVMRQASILGAITFPAETSQT